MDKTLNHFINKDAYLQEWRQKVAFQLTAIGMPDHLIIFTLTTSKRTDLVNIARSIKISPKELLKIIGL